VVCVPPHFGVGVPYPHFLRAVTAVVLLQRSPDSLARFVEVEKVRKGARERKWRRQGR